MNKHIQTLIGFKNGSRKLATESFYDLWDAWDEIVSAFKKIGYVIFVLVMWFVALALICVLPLATWLRLRWERQYEAQVAKRKQEILDDYNPVKRGDNA